MYITNRLRNYRQHFRRHIRLDWCDEVILQTLGIYYPPGWITYIQWRQRLARGILKTQASGSEIKKEKWKHIKTTNSWSKVKPHITPNGTVVAGQKWFHRSERYNPTRETTGAAKVTAEKHPNKQNVTSTGHETNKASGSIRSPKLHQIVATERGWKYKFR